MNESNEERETKSEEKLPFWKMLLSVVQASFGVQNKKNKERDFASGNIKGFIVAALIFTVLFVVTVATVVNLVLP